VSFSVQGADPLDASIGVRLTIAEKDKLREDADLAGLSISELVRRRYFGLPILSNADVVQLRELRRIGGLLKHMHVESGGAYASATHDCLVELQSYIRKLSKRVRS
jgi:hypothetical protein